jgi:hypothetical protein
MMWTSLRSKEFIGARVITRDSGEHDKLPSCVGAGGITSSLMSLSMENNSSVFFSTRAFFTSSTPSTSKRPFMWAITNSAWFQCCLTLFRGVFHLIS